VSRRFGRNQRRRARHELEVKALELRLANEHIHGQDRRLLRMSDELSQMRRKIEALEAVTDGVRQALGDRSILLKPVLGMVLGHYLPTVQLHDAMGFSEDYIPTANLRLEEIKTTTYAILDCELEDKHWARCQHFYVKVKDQKMVGYAFDESMLRMQASRKTFIYNVAKMIAATLDEMIADGRLKVA